MVGAVDAERSPFRTAWPVALGVLAAALAVLAFLPAAEAQPPPASPPGPAPTNCNYVIDNNIPFSWVDISTNGTGMSGWTADTSTAWINPSPAFYGFVCNAYGNNFLLSSKGHFCVAMSASMANVPGCGWCCDAPGPLPSSSYARPGVWGFYADLHPGLCTGGNGGSCIFYKVFGTSPNRWLLYSFQNVPYYGASSTTNSFQMRLYESNGCIETHYQSTQPSGTSWPRNAAGYNGDGGTTSLGWQYAYSASGLSLSSTAWRACPQGGLPPLCTPVSTTVGPGGTVTFTASFGQTPYAWSVTPGGSAPSSGAGPTFTSTFTAPGTYTVTVTGANGGSATCTVRVVVPFCGYTIKTTVNNPEFSYNWEEISPAAGGGGTPVPGLWYYSNYALSPPGMNFKFCGDTFPTMLLGGAGQICFRNSLVPTGTYTYYWSDPTRCSYPSPTPLPSTSTWTPKPAVFGAWNLVNPGYCPGYQSANCLYYKIQGTAPERTIIYEFDNVPIAWGYTPNQSFQIKLFEASGCIEAHYRSIANAPSYPWYGTSAGYHNADGSAGYNAFFHSAYTTWSRSGYAWQACPFSASPDAYTVNEDQAAQAFDVTTNDNGAGQAFSVTSYTLPSKGTLVRGTGIGDFTYQPHPNVVGTDSFTYTIRNTFNTMSSVGTVTITINPVNDPPTFEGSAQLLLSTPSDGPQTIPGWGRLVKPGPDAAVDEVGQGIDFVVVSNSEPAIFASPPTLKRSMDDQSLEPPLTNVAGSYAILHYVPSGEPGRAEVCFSAVDTGGTGTSTNSFGGTATGVNIGPPQCAQILLNAPPVAYFEPSTIMAGARTALTFNPCPGPAPKCTHDPDGLITAYLWEFGDGGSSAIDSPSHTYDVPGTYEVRLTVWDDQGVHTSYLRAVDVVAAEAMPPEEEAASIVPAPNAGVDRIVVEGTLVQLEGSQEGGPETTAFAWEQSAGTTVLLSDAASAVPTFLAPLLPTMEPVDLVFSLRVEDRGLRSEPDYVTIRVVSANRAPVADAGGSREAAIGDVVTLGGPNTGDPDGDALTYRWEHLLDPGEALIVLSDPTSASPTFTASKAGSYEFRLTVSDGKATAVDIAIVSIQPVVALGEGASAQGVREPAADPVAAGAPAAKGGIPMPLVLAAVGMLLLAGALALVLVRRTRQ